MPKKQVVEYTCERCARVWYLDATAPEPATKLKLLLEMGRTKDSPDGAAVAYECLCDSCSDTVASLVKQIAPLKPRQPRAKKKDESADKGNPPSTDPAVTTDAAPAEPKPAPTPSAPPARASVGVPSTSGGGQAAPSGAPHPKR